MASVWRIEMSRPSPSGSTALMWTMSQASRPSGSRVVPLMSPPAGLGQLDVVARVPRPEHAVVRADLLDLGVEDRGVAGLAERAEVDVVARPVGDQEKAPAREFLQLVEVGRSPDRLQRAHQRAVEPPDL